MNSLKVKLNSSGVREMLKSAEMQSLLAERAQAVVNRLGDGYAADPYVGKNRANVSIHPETAKAFRETYKREQHFESIEVTHD